MLDWLIVGGGLQGSHIARRLIAARPNADIADIAVLDPQPTALDEWRRRADACGMHYLRSSQAHHLGLHADALRAFAHRHGYDRRHAMGRYRRPSRALFEAHVLEVTAPVARIRARAKTVERNAGVWRAVIENGETHAAHNVVLACGSPDVARPAWGAQLPHVFAPGFAAHTADWPTHQHIVVIGGGISAAQYAIARAQDGHPVTLLTRHPLRQTAFDSQPCFSGPRCLQPFLRLPMANRPVALARARNPGTLPADVYTELATQLASGAIRWIRGDVASLADDGPQLADGRRVKADRVVLATGFQPRADALCEHTAARLNLPLDEHGYAHVDASLAWAPGLYVAGRPASLQLGPMAGNIRGARLAGERLARVAHSEALPSSCN